MSEGGQCLVAKVVAALPYWTRPGFPLGLRTAAASRSQAIFFEYICQCLAVRHAPTFLTPDSSIPCMFTPGRRESCGRHRLAWKKRASLNISGTRKLRCHPRWRDLPGKVTSLLWNLSWKMVSSKQAVRLVKPPTERSVLLAGMFDETRALLKIFSG